MEESHVVLRRDLRPDRADALLDREHNGLVEADRGRLADDPANGSASIVGLRSGPNV